MIFFLKYLFLIILTLEFMGCKIFTNGESQKPFQMLCYCHAYGSKQIKFGLSEVVEWHTCMKPSCASAMIHSVHKFGQEHILSHWIKFDTSDQVMLNLSQLGTTVEMGLSHLLQLLIKTFLLFRKIFTTCLSCLQEISYIFTMVK